MKQLLVILIPFNLPILNKTDLFSANFTNSNIIGITLNKVITENHLDTDIRILFIHGNEFQSSFKSILKKVFCEKDEIYLVVQKGNKEILHHENSIAKIAGSLLKLPVKDIDPSVGKTFHEFLLSLSEAFLSGQTKEFKNRLKGYFKQFQFDYDLEAKLKLLSLIENEEFNLIQTTQPTSKLDFHLTLLLENPEVKKAINKIQTTPFEKKETLLLLQELFFPQS